MAARMPHLPGQQHRILLVKEILVAAGAGHDQGQASRNRFRCGDVKPFTASRQNRGIGVAIQRQHFVLRQVALNQHDVRQAGVALPQTGDLRGSLVLRIGESLDDKAY